MSKDTSIIQNFDVKSPKSIERFAQKMIGQSFWDILHHAGFSDADASYYGNKAKKGGLGTLVEEQYFGYKANSESRPDFEEAGVELKATPFEKKTNGELRAGERLVLSMISYKEKMEEKLFDSHLWNKCRLLLLVYYHRDKSLADSLFYAIRYVRLFTPSEMDLAVIQRDYSYIANKVIGGLAHTLSEGDTMYLGACTKGSTALDSIVPQEYYAPSVNAKKRAFCYKNSYMTYVLNHYLVAGVDTYVPTEAEKAFDDNLKQGQNTSVLQSEIQSIVNNPEHIKTTSFEKYITVYLMHKYLGLTDRKLCSVLGVPYTRNKAQWTTLTYRMLGIKSNQAEEFVKANIVVKVIRLEENGKMRENMSFTPFKYCELVKETWENSTFGNYLEETRFLFVVFKSNGHDYVFKGMQFWNMPYRDREFTTRQGWEKVVETIKNGVVLSYDENKHIVNNNLPKQTDNAIIHVRPHAAKSYYRFKDGSVYGSGSVKDANPLPDGQWMTNYSFWLNNSYIESQLKTDFVN